MFSHRWSIFPNFILIQKSSKNAQIPRQTAKLAAKIGCDHWMSRASHKQFRIQFNFNNKFPKREFSFSRLPTPQKVQENNQSPNSKFKNKLTKVLSTFQMLEFNSKNSLDLIVNQKNTLKRTRPTDWNYDEWWLELMMNMCDVRW